MNTDDVEYVDYAVDETTMTIGREIRECGEIHNRSDDDIQNIDIRLI